MTNKPKRRTPLIRRLISIVAVFAVFLMVVPMASATELEGTVQLRTLYGWESSTSLTMVDNFMNATYSATGTQVMSLSSSTKNARIGLDSFSLGLSDITGSVGLYLSYYWYGNSGATATGAVQPVTGSYTNSDGNSGTVTSVGVGQFTTTDSQAVGKGIRYECRYSGSEAYPIGNLGLNLNTSTQYAPVRLSEGIASIKVTSFRVISTEYNAELDAMENMADELAQQSEMMEAMYGEIIALCNAIYQRLGNMETALDLTKTYCQQMIGYLDNIDSNVSNIYTLLGTQFALLISTIENESSNIQTAIANAEAKLEAYFDGAATDSGLGEAGDEVTSTDDELTGVMDDESVYISNASSNYADLVASFPTFNNNILDGIALVGVLFTNVWNALGEYKVVYTFPLYVAIALVCIGRVSKSSMRDTSEHNTKGVNDREKEPWWVRRKM